MYYLKKRNNYGYNPINWITELAAWLILLLMIINIRNRYMQNVLPVFIVNCVVYLILSVVLYYSNSPSIISKQIRRPELFGRKYDITEPEAVDYLNKGAIFSGLFKISIMLIPITVLIPDNFWGMNKFFLVTLLVVILLIIAFYMIAFSIRNFIHAKGYTEVSVNQTIKYAVFYYNPEDKAAVVDRSFGFGQTINLASKQGRLILWIILAVPVVIVTLLLVIFRISGKM